MRRLAPLLPLLLAGCSAAFDPGLCTMEAAMVTVRVQDAAGQPVPDAAVEVTRVATGRSLACVYGQVRGCVKEEPFLKERGEYVVVNDGVPVAKAGEDFRVVATRGASRAEGVVRAGFDGCHVQKLAGPAVLTLAP